MASAGAAHVAAVALAAAAIVAVTVVDVVVAAAAGEASPHSNLIPPVAAGQKEPCAKQRDFRESYAA